MRSLVLLLVACNGEVPGVVHTDDDPLFEDESWRGFGRLEAGEAFRIRDGSPAIAAGMGLMTPPPEMDYFGEGIPTPPAIGMHQPQ